VLFAVLGQLLLGADFTDGMAVLFGAVGFGAALWLVRLLATGMARNADYQPVILSVETEPAEGTPKFFIP
jgi:hypothetical protein